MNKLQDRHCEEQSDEAISLSIKWLSQESAFNTGFRVKDCRSTLAMTGLGFHGNINE